MIGASGKMTRGRVLSLMSWLTSCAGSDVMLLNLAVSLFQATKRPTKTKTGRYAFWSVMEYLGVVESFFCDEGPSV